jgi:DNA-binding XRE family transcriptional regulator
MDALPVMPIAGMTWLADPVAASDSRWRCVSRHLRNLDPDERPPIATCCHRAVDFYERPDTRLARAVFGRGIAQARLSAGLSQRSLAGLAGLNQSTISRLETGTTAGVRYETLMRILHGLGVREVRIVATPWFWRQG